MSYKMHCWEYKLTNVWTDRQIDSSMVDMLRTVQSPAPETDSTAWA